MVVPRPRWRHVLEAPPFLSDSAVQILKASVASGLAWEAGVLLGQPKPYFAVLAVVVTMTGNTYGSLLKGGQYLLGVLVGMLLGVVAQGLVGLSAPIVSLMILGALAIGTRVKVGRDPNIQIAISALLMLAIGVVNWGVTRLWETAVGGVIAVLVAAFLWPPNPVRRVTEGMARRERRLRDDLVRACELVDAPVRNRAAAGHLTRVRRAVEEADDGIAEISAAYDALRWNPWHGARRAELESLEGRARLVARLYLHVRSTVRYISDSITRSEAEPPDWIEARGTLLEAVNAVCDALDMAIRDEDAGPELERARAARQEFAARTEGDALAGAIGIELGHLIGELSAGRPEPEAPPSWWRRAMALFRRHRLS